jgi:hypothetical protein
MPKVPIFVGLVRDILGNASEQYCPYRSKYGTALLGKTQSIRPLLKTKVPHPRGQGATLEGSVEACWRTLTTSRGVTAIAVTIDPIEPATSRGIMEGATSGFVVVTRRRGFVDCIVESLGTLRFYIHTLIPLTLTGRSCCHKMPASKKKLVTKHGRVLANSKVTSLLEAEISPYCDVTFSF